MENNNKIADFTVSLKAEDEVVATHEVKNEDANRHHTFVKAMVVHKFRNDGFIVPTYKSLTVERTNVRRV